MDHRPFAAASLMVLWSAVAHAAPITVSVPGTSNPWLAGMPAGSTASLGDVAPAQSPVELLGLAFTPGDLLVFSATGATDHCTAGGCGMAPAEGDASEAATGHVPGAQNGIANVFAPIDGLIGVFLGPDQPNLTPAPGALDFASGVARDFASLAPILQQPFFIGNGLRNDGATVQTFEVPIGASRLFLGTMDGFGWFNNVGALQVTVDRADDVDEVPEPTFVLLLGAALAGAGLRLRRPRH